MRPTSLRAPGAGGRCRRHCRPLLVPGDVAGPRPAALGSGRLSGFRFPLELLMHRAYVEGLMPVQMSYSGQNYDIVSGITAGALALWLGRGRAPRGVVATWNVLGFLLLVNIVTVAVVSTPRFDGLARKAEHVRDLSTIRLVARGAGRGSTDGSHPRVAVAVGEACLLNQVTATPRDHPADPRSGSASPRAA